jgi:hypothetical protein
LLEFGSLENKPSDNAAKDDASIWRDTGLRYGGYADEVGEFAAPFLGRTGQFVGYGISTVYCLLDMFATTLPKKFKIQSDNDVPVKTKTRNTMAEALDLGLFHYVATLWIPPMLIGSVVEMADKLLDKDFKHEASSDRLRRLLQNGLGKLIKPFQSKSTQAVDAWLNTTGSTLVKGKPLETANALFAKNKTTLASSVKFFANIGSVLEHIPGLKALIGAQGLHHDAKAVQNKVGFTPKELAKLVFIKPIPLLIGVGMIPLIAHPFDKLMVAIQNWTIRPLIGKNKISTTAKGGLKSEHNPGFLGEKPAVEKSVSHAVPPLLKASPSPCYTFNPFGNHASSYVAPVRAASPIAQPVILAQGKISQSMILPGKMPASKIPAYARTPYPVSSTGYYGRLY